MALGKIKCAGLEHNGLKGNLSEVVILSLINSMTKVDFPLDGLTTISIASAAALSKYKGCQLELNGLIILSVAAAMALAKFNGGSFDLMVLKEFPNLQQHALLNLREHLC